MIKSYAVRLNGAVRVRLLDMTGPHLQRLSHKFGKLWHLKSEFSLCQPAQLAKNNFQGCCHINSHLSEAFSCMNLKREKKVNFPKYS